MSMNGKAGNFGDVPKHLILTELAMIKLQALERDGSFCFFDAFGGNYISDNCQNEAKNFFENLKSDNGIKLKKSTYFEIMQQRLWDNGWENKYFGSIKWIEEVISLNGKINKFKLIYNSNDLNDVVTASTLVFSSTSHIKEKYSFQMADAYKILEDYKRAIRSFDKGIILIDPYWKKKNSREIDLEGCKKIVEEIIPEISAKKGWSILIWLPIYTQRYLDIFKEMKKYVKNKCSSCSNESLKCEVFKIKDEDEEVKNTKDPQNIKGVNLFLITTDKETENHFKKIDIDKLGGVVKKQGKDDYRYIYNYEYEKL